MKKLIKVVKVLIILTIIKIAVVGGGIFLGHKVFFKMPYAAAPTIESVTDGKMAFGPEAHKHVPKTVKEMVDVLAVQLVHYNNIAESVWPNVNLVNQSLVVEDYQKNEFYYISPQGDIEKISRQEALDMGVSRMPTLNGFNIYDGGMYLAMIDEDIQNYLIWQKYLHYGIFDAFIFFNHEGFHIKEQIKWEKMNQVPNAERKSYLDAAAERTTRYFLQIELMDAAANPGQPDKILEALAMYQYWKETYPEDFQNAIIFDRVEGTAYYFEIITCLLSAYHEQIQTHEDVQHALTLLATRPEIYIGHGLDMEGYTVGAFAGFLLDRLGVDWKQTLMDTADATPMSLLYEHFNGTALPEPYKITQEDIDYVVARIDTKDPNDASGLPMLFKMLYEFMQAFLPF